MKTFRFIISTAVKEDYSVLACYQLLFLFLVYLHSGSSLVGSLLTETLASKQYVENIESERGIVITIPKAFLFLANILGIGRSTHLLVLEYSQKLCSKKAACV